MYDLLKARIKAAIDAAGTSANALSLAANLDRGFIRKIGLPQGKKGEIPEPGALKLKTIACLLHVPTSWLIDAINPDETELRRGAIWPPPDTIIAPKPGQLIEDPDELALLAFWKSLDQSQKGFMLSLLRNGALNMRMK